MLEDGETIDIENLQVCDEGCSSKSEQNKHDAEQNMPDEGNLILTRTISQAER